MAQLREQAPRLRARVISRSAGSAGSRVRQPGRESDLDLLIEVDPKSRFSLLDVDLPDDLRALPGRARISPSPPISGHGSARKSSPRRSRSSGATAPQPFASASSTSCRASRGSSSSRPAGPSRDSLPMRGCARWSRGAPCSRRGQSRAPGDSLASQVVGIGNVIRRDHDATDDLVMWATATGRLLPPKAAARSCCPTADLVNCTTARHMR
jgi:hypothetical protein